MNNNWVLYEPWQQELRRPEPHHLPPGARLRDILIGLLLVKIAMYWAFMVSMTGSDILHQFPLLALIAVLATGGLEDENALHNFLVVVARYGNSQEGEQQPQQDQQQPLVRNQHANGFRQGLRTACRDFCASVAELYRRALNCPGCAWLNAQQPQQDQQPHGRWLAENDHANGFWQRLWTTWKNVCTSVAELFCVALICSCCASLKALRTGNPQDGGEEEEGGVHQEDEQAQEGQHAVGRRRWSRMVWDNVCRLVAEIDCGARMRAGCAWLKALLSDPTYREHDIACPDGWREWMAEWKPKCAMTRMRRSQRRCLKAYQLCRRIGILIGLGGFIFFFVVLVDVTSFVSVAEVEGSGADNAANPDGVFAICGARSCTELSPRTVDVLGVSGEWVWQRFECADTTSIECEEPTFRAEVGRGNESSFSFVLEISNDTDAEVLHWLSLQIDGGSEEPVLVNNTDRMIDGLWWTMNNDWSYVKIRWSPLEDASFVSEEVFRFDGLTSVETEPLVTSPFCFTHMGDREDRGWLGSTQETDTEHSLSESDARDILRNSYMNTFYRGVYTGNPYRSLFFDDGSKDSMIDAILDMGNISDDNPISCADGTEDENDVSVEDFLSSQDLEADRVHVLGAGDYSWLTKSTTTSKFFTEELAFFGEDEDEVTTIASITSVVLFVTIAIGFVGCGPAARFNRFPIGLFAMPGSLVGRMALTLILSECSVFLTVTSRGEGLSEDSAEEDAVQSAAILKWLSYGLLWSIALGDGIFAPYCWLSSGRKAVRTILSANSPGEAEGRVLTVNWDDSEYLLAEASVGHFAEKFTEFYRNGQGPLELSVTLLALGQSPLGVVDVFGANSQSRIYPVEVPDPSIWSDVGAGNRCCGVPSQVKGALVVLPVRRAPGDPGVQRIEDNNIRLRLGHNNRDINLMKTAVEVPWP